MMYDISIKNVKKGRNFYLIFLLLGLLFLLIICSILTLNFIKLKSLDSNTLSNRVEVNSHYDDEGAILYSPIYYYSVDGRNYVCNSSSSSSINPGTTNKKVYYDSKNPSNCMTEYSKSNSLIFLVFMILPLVFILIGVINIKKVNKRIKIINELNQKGKLIKNLPYRLEDTGMTVNNVRIKRPVVDYTLPSGSSITLYGDPRHDRKIADLDGMVDLVIDESNPNNYFIDFEINRISGNLPTDYYDDKYNSYNDQTEQNNYETENIYNSNNQN